MINRNEEGVSKNYRLIRKWDDNPSDLKQYLHKSFRNIISQIYWESKIPVFLPVLNNQNPYSRDFFQNISLLKRQTNLV